MMQPRISIVLPVYNGARYLEAAIRSVLVQTLEDWELLIGDDASTDNSRRIIDSFRDFRIRVYKASERRGLFRNLNALLSEINAPLVRFLCQDDVLEPTCLESEVQYFEATPDIVMAYCEWSDIDEHDRVIGHSSCLEQSIHVPPHVALQMLLYYGCIPGNLSTVCVRRRVFEETGPFDEALKVAGDYDMWVKVCRHGLLAIVNKTLVRIRTHSSRLSVAADSGMHFVRENRRIRERVFSEIPQRLQPRARRFILLRHNVSDTHFAIRTLLRGNLFTFLDVARELGIGDFLAGLIFWVVTANNKLWRPTVRIAATQ